MKKSEFEERTYEIPLYYELARPGRLWSPGQVLEHRVGFDATMFSGNIDFWRMVGIENYLKGVLLGVHDFSNIALNFNDKSLPSYKVNLFIQAKRSEFLNGKNEELYKLGIKDSYYRFDINFDQQEILENLSQKLGDNALVCYAAPVFVTYEDFHRFAENKMLYSNSTFIKVDRLKNHKRWIFDKSGSEGIACSVKENIKDDGLFEILGKKLNNLKAKSNERSDNFAKNLQHLSYVILELLQDSELQDNPLIRINKKAIFETMYLYKEKTVSFNNDMEIVINYLLVYEFCSCFNIKWGIFA